MRTIDAHTVAPGDGFAGRLMVLGSPPASLTAGGWWAGALVMDVIVLFALLQLVEWRRLRRLEPSAGGA